jgi:hypothetical protein
LALRVISTSWPSVVSRRIRRSLEKFGEPSVEQCRDLGLVDAHEGCGGHLGQATALDDLPDMARKLCLGQLFLGLGEAQIGKHVAAARRHRDFGALELFWRRGRIGTRWLFWPNCVRSETTTGGQEREPVR